MRRIEYTRYGGPEELHLADFQQAPPVGNQIQVRIKAASANPMDWKIREGAVKMMTGKTFPRGVGTDFSGVVQAVGPDVRRFKPGDEVFGAMSMRDSATFSEVIVTGEETAALKPSAIGFEVAATLPIAGATAWTALIDTAALRRGQRVLINGCLGGVGRAALQIARVHGASIVGTCGATGVAEARGLGAEEAIDYRKFDYRGHRKSFDIVFDTAGSLGPRKCLSMLKPGGVALHINLSPLKMIQILLTRRNKAVIAKLPPDLLEKLGELAVQGNLKLPIAGIVPLTEAIPAITKLETSGQPKGKLVIVPA